MNRITYSFDIDDEFVEQLVTYKSLTLTVEESNELDAFDGAMVMNVITFIVTSVLSGAAYDIAKSLLLKVKNRTQKNSTSLAVQLEDLGETFIYANRKFYRQNKEGKVETTEEIWLDELCARID